MRTRRMASRILVILLLISLPLKAHEVPYSVDPAVVLELARSAAYHFASEEPQGGLLLKGDGIFIIMCHSPKETEFALVDDWYCSAQVSFLVASSIVEELTGPDENGKCHMSRWYESISVEVRTDGSVNPGRGSGSSSTSAPCETEPGSDYSQ
jgi:hypothetical protein